MMDVIKIDIEQQLLTIRENTLDIYRARMGAPDHFGAVPLFEGIEFDDVWTIYTTKHYEVVTKSRAELDADGNLVRVKKNYLIPIAEYGLFSDLIDISDHLLAKLIDERTRGVSQRENAYIKGLPWWARLLKRF